MGLDFTSIQAIESVLNLYQGAILAISHDAAFLNNIRIEKRILMR